MKNFIKTGAVVAALLCGIATADAKAKVEKQIVTKSFLTTIDCHSCAEKIMKVVPYQKGVKDVVVDVAKKSVTVKYDASKNSEKALVESLKRLDIEVVEKGAASCCDGCK